MTSPALRAAATFATVLVASGTLISCSASSAGTTINLYIPPEDHLRGRPPTNCGSASPTPSSRRA